MDKEQQMKHLTSTSNVKQNFVLMVDINQIDPSDQSSDRKAFQKENEATDSQANGIYSASQTCDQQVGPEVREAGIAHDTPEGGWGWMVVLGAFLVYWLIPGIIRSYGAVHLEILETFPECTEAEASWIPALLTSMTVGLAPISGVLAKMYTSRNVVFTGGLFCFTGLSLSYFATNIYELQLTLGFITGIGSGLVTTPSVITVNSYFVKKRAFATGICFSGAAFGSLTIPSLVKILVATYTLRGAMLIMGAAVANLCVCSLLFTPDGKWPTTSSKCLENGKAILQKDDRAITSTKRIQENVTHLPQLHHPEGCHRQERALSMSEYSSVDNHKPKVSTFHSLNDISTASIYYANKIDRLCEDATNTITSKTGALHFFKMCLNLRLFLKVSYTLTVICAVGVAGAHPHVLIYVPAYAVTLGMSKVQAGMLISIASMVDLFGRIGYGYFNDLQIMSRANALAVGCFISTLGALFIPACTSFGTLAVSTACFGFGTGTMFMLLPVILADNHGIDLMPSTYGLLRLFQGLILLIMPPIAGAIKDYTGKYQPCFFVMGMIIFTGVLAMLFMPCALRYDKKRESKENQCSSIPI